MARSIGNMVFRLKWLFMPREARYAYLWARTRSSLRSDYPAADRENY